MEEATDQNLDPKPGRRQDTPGRLTMGIHPGKEPCAFCGRLIMPGIERCGHCGLPLSDDYRQTARHWMGPWFVFKDKNPSAAGYSLQAVRKLIEKGEITPMSVVRGPTTGGEWRFATQVPDISRFLGYCWKCNGGISANDAVCAACGASQDRDPSVGVSARTAGEPKTGELTSFVQTSGVAAPASSRRVKKPLRQTSPAVLALFISNLITLGFLGITGYLLWSKIPKTVQPWEVPKKLDEIKQAKAKQKEAEEAKEMGLPSASAPVPRSWPPQCEKAWQDANGLAEGGDEVSLRKAFDLLKDIQKQTIPSDRPPEFSMLLERVQGKILQIEKQYSMEGTEEGKTEAKDETKQEPKEQAAPETKEEGKQEEK